MPFVSRTRAIFRSAEFGFLGVIVETRVQTPRFCGAPWRAGVFVFSRLDVRPLRISWLTVGMSPFCFGSLRRKGRRRRFGAPPNQARHGSKGSEVSSGFRRRADATADPVGTLPKMLEIAAIAGLAAGLLVAVV